MKLTFSVLETFTKQHLECHQIIEISRMVGGVIAKVSLPPFLEVVAFEWFKCFV